MLEWLAPALTKVGRALVQAEDELASINMAIGASFGGRASITATSGPGWRLWSNRSDLATASEVPIVVVDVMRGGPSTGIPTKVRAVRPQYRGLRLPRRCAAHRCGPLDVADCLFTAQWAVHLAEAMQVPAIVSCPTSRLARRAPLIDRPANIAFIAKRNVLDATIGAAYNRYALTAVRRIADGHTRHRPVASTLPTDLTHAHKRHTVFQGIPITRDQLDKRRDKIEKFDYGNHWADIESGNGAGCRCAKFTILTWGSLAGPAREAMRIVWPSEGIAVKLVAMRLDRTVTQTRNSWPPWRDHNAS